MGAKYRVIQTGDSPRYYCYRVEKLKWYGSWCRLKTYDTKKEAEEYCEQHAKGLRTYDGLIVSEFESKE